MRAISRTGGATRTGLRRAMTASERSEDAENMENMTGVGGSKRWGKKPNFEALHTREKQRETERKAAARQRVTKVQPFSFDARSRGSGRSKSAKGGKGGKSAKGGKGGKGGKSVKGTGPARRVRRPLSGGEGGRGPLQARGRDGDARGFDGGDDEFEADSGALASILSGAGIGYTENGELTTETGAGRKPKVGAKAARRATAAGSLLRSARAAAEASSTAFSVSRANGSKVDRIARRRSGGEALRTRAPWGAGPRSAKKTSKPLRVRSAKKARKARSIKKAEARDVREAREAREARAVRVPRAIARRQTVNALMTESVDESPTSVALATRIRESLAADSVLLERGGPRLERELVFGDAEDSSVATAGVTTVGSSVSAPGLQATRLRIESQLLLLESKKKTLMMGVMEIESAQAQLEQQLGDPCLSAESASAVLGSVTQKMENLDATLCTQCSTRAAAESAASAVRACETAKATREAKLVAQVEAAKASMDAFVAETEEAEAETAAAAAEAATLSEREARLAFVRAEEERLEAEIAAIAGAMDEAEASDDDAAAGSAVFKSVVAAGVPGSVSSPFERQFTAQGLAQLDVGRLERSMSESSEGLERAVQLMREGSATPEPELEALQFEEAEPSPTDLAREEALSNPNARELAARLWDGDARPSHLTNHLVSPQAQLCSPSSAR